MIESRSKAPQPSPRPFAQQTGLGVLEDFRDLTVSWSSFAVDECNFEYSRIDPNAF
jgi:hypothetical protein